jgi:hypothetical protein
MIKTVFGVEQSVNYKRLLDWFHARKESAGEYNGSKWFRCYQYFIDNFDYAGKTILEFGARDSILGPYLTDKAEKVYLCDNFEQIHWHFAR